MDTYPSKLQIILCLLGWVFPCIIAYAGGQSHYCFNYDESRIQQQADKEQQMLEQSQPNHRRIIELHRWVAQEKALLNQAQQDRKQICKFSKQVADDVDKHMKETNPSADSCKAFEEMGKILNPPFVKLTGASEKIHQAYDDLTEKDGLQMDQHKSAILELKGKPGIDVPATVREILKFYQHGNGPIMSTILHGMHEEIEHLDAEAEKLLEMLRQVKSNEQKCKMQALNAQIKASMANPPEKPGKSRR